MALLVFGVDTFGDTVQTGRYVSGVRHHKPQRRLVDAAKIREVLGITHLLRTDEEAEQDEDAT